MGNPETIKNTTETTLDSKELESLNNNRREELRNSLDAAEKNHKDTTKESLGEARQAAVEHAESSKKMTQKERSPAEKRPGVISLRQRDDSFRKQMNNIAPHLSKNEQAFSKVIHTKAVEKTSDTLSKTIARPNALLAGSVTAFLAVTLVYVLAKYYGYSLSGFETIAAFIFGWSIGLIYDYLRVLIGNKR